MQVVFDDDNEQQNGELRLIASKFQNQSINHLLSVVYRGNASDFTNLFDTLLRVFPRRIRKYSSSLR